jgi:transcriptional regulator with XRE-family HTH domain
MGSKKKETATPEFPESFKAARKNFAKNLTKLLTHLGYTAATLSLKVNTICESDTIATSDVYEWLAGTKIPSVYHLYKLSVWLHIPMDALFTSSFDSTTVDGRSFAKQSITYSVSEEELVEAEPATTKENTSMAKNTAIVSISRTSKKQMEQIVSARTDSKSYNLLLANKLYNTDMQLKEIAAKVGVSTRSLRDYAFYNTSVPATVAEKLVKLFKTSYRNLGLQYDSDRDRYTHMTVKIKA